MANILAAPTEERTSPVSSRTSTRTSRRSRSATDEESALGARFFLPKSGANGKAFEPGRELSSEGEARVEALKLGVTYYSVQEWRPVADFAGKNPELKREVVARKEPG